MSKLKENKPRNPFHNHPLMFKGGVHEKSKKAKRRTEKQKFKKEWCSLMVIYQTIKKHYSFFKLGVAQSD